MVRWAENVVYSDNIKRKKKTIAAINKRKATFNIYCITYASSQCNLFDIIDANELLFPHYRSIDVCIVGLAKGKAEAILLVKDMLMDVYTNTGGFDVRTYFT
ncbi:MAG: hypothetical protein K0S47_1925 [Herbinix sp.]|jgi:hypothetical protein|nr:hypothetical protein [Herbinix sp.]